MMELAQLIQSLAVCRSRCMLRCMPYITRQVGMYLPLLRSSMTACRALRINHQASDMFYRDLREMRDLCYWTAARTGCISSGFYEVNQNNRGKSQTRINGGREGSMSRTGCQCQRQSGRLASKAGMFSNISLFQSNTIIDR
jgi:hypothetical protein